MMVHKIFAPFTILIISSLACSLPGGIMGPTLTPTPTETVTLGTFDLAQNTHSLTFQVVGKDPDSPYYSFGLDCFSLVPAQ
jgi:hypothetical protein